MAVRIQFRRGTAAEWASANPTLAAGELGYETDTTKFKLGDGTTDWTTLSYAGVTQADIEAAVEGVVGLAPENLNTLVELAAAIGDDSDFFNTVSATIDTHVDATTNVHGIADTSVLETETGAQTKANSAQANAASYTDNAIANLVASAPGTLDTLNELAAALGDDPNFATTLATTLSEKINFVVDTGLNLTTANATTELNTLYIESDTGGYVRVGDGVTAYNDLAFIGKDYSDNLVSTHASSSINIHGISDTANLAYQVDITNAIAAAQSVADALETHETSTLEVHGIANTADIVFSSDLTDTIAAHSNTTSNIHGIANTADLVVSADLDAHTNGSLNVHGIANTAELVIQSDLNSHTVATVNVHGISNTANLVYNADIVGTYATLESPSFVGTVLLPSTTSIGDVSAADLATLANVTSDIQAQIDGKLASSVASTTYAPIASPTFTGTVALPSDTTIGDVSATELGYISTVTSNVQNQLDGKAPIANPTFTGTVSGITAAMIGLGDVDNTADLDKPVSNAVQTALDLKADLSSPVFTGEVEAADLVVTGNLIVQGTTTTVSASDLKVKDNMIYLNNAGLSTLSGAVGDGTNVIYTTTEAHGYDAGDYVTVSGVTPSSFDVNSTGLEILAVTENTFTVASTVTDTYVSGGTARGKVHTNPDLGWAAGRYADGTYAHAGMFRDATDGVFKFFDGYVPEPDNSVFIDTSDNTFALADVAVADLTATNMTAASVTFVDGTTQTSAGVASLTSFTEKTANYTLDTLAHKDNVVEMNSSSATTFTIPTNASLAWPVGASMDIIQTGSGQVTIAPDSGVTLRYTPGNKLRTQWSSCTIIKRSADLWYMYGDLTA
jgi:hypothetical protein